MAEAMDATTVVENNGCLAVTLSGFVIYNKPELDFFGRAIVPKEKPLITTTGEDGKAGDVVHIGKAVGNSDVWFRFNEGVSNAVRRNVYIRELL